MKLTMHGCLVLACSLGWLSSAAAADTGGITISLGRDGRSFIAAGAGADEPFLVRVAGGGGAADELPPMAGAVEATDGGLRRVRRARRSGEGTVFSGSQKRAD